MNIDHTLEDGSLNEALVTACRNGNIVLISNLLSFKVNVNFQDSNGNTALMSCASHGYTSIARLLLNNGAKINITNNNGDSALHLSATKFSPTDLMLLFFEKDELDIFLKNLQGQTFLMNLVKLVDIDSIALFLTFFNQNGILNKKKELFDGYITEAEAFAEARGLPNILKYLKEEILHLKSAYCKAGSQSDLQSVRIILKSEMFKHSRFRTRALQSLLQFYIDTSMKIKDVDIAIVCAYLENEADSNVKYAYSAPEELELAVKLGNAKLLDILYTFHKNRNPLFNDRWLELAVIRVFENCKCDILKILLKHNPNIVSLHCYKNECLTNAFRIGALDFIKMVLSNEKKEEVIELNDCFNAALSNGQYHCFDLLLELFPSYITSLINVGYFDSFHEAVGIGNIKLIAKLITKGADVNQEYMSKTPLMYCRSAKVAKLLLKRGANLYSKKDNRYLSAIANIHQNMKCMMKHRRSHSNHTQSEEFSNEIDQCKKLITLYKSHGSNIDEKNEFGKTALIVAAKEKDMANLMKCLLEAGADPNAMDNEGRTALYYAISINSVQNVNVLLLFQANVNIRLKNGKTCLFYAVEMKAHDMMSILIKHGAQVNTQDDDGNTPLMLAVNDMGSGYDVVHELIQSGADVNLQNRSGNAAVNYALDQFRTKILVLLCKNGANLKSRCFLSMLFGGFLHINILEGRSPIRHEDTIICIKYLLKLGACASQVGYDLVFELISQDHFDILKMLIQAGLCPEEYFITNLGSYLLPAKTNYSFFSYALRFQKLEFAKYLYDISFLTYHDILNKRRIDAIISYLASVNGMETIQFIENSIYCRPVPLKKLCVMRISLYFNRDREREAKINTLPISQKIKELLLFKTDQTHNSLYTDPSNEISFLESHLLALDTK